MISQHHTVLKQGDVLKVDFGVHVRGRIVDSAFTLTWNHTYDKLLEAVQAATNTGVRVSFSNQCSGLTGRSSCLRKPGSMYGSATLRQPFRKPWNPTKLRSEGRSYPVRPYHPPVFGSAERSPVKPIANLSGHSINQYQIHGGKSVQLVKNNDQTKMEEGEYFAIETFGSTGRGHVVEAGECSHYAKVVDAPHVPLRSGLSRRSGEPYPSDDYSSMYRLTSAKSLLKTINKEFGTLPFCRRYLDRVGESKYLLAVCEPSKLKSTTPDSSHPTAQQPRQPGYR